MTVELLTDIELAGIRTDVEQLFEDTCIVERITSLGTLNHGTGEYTGQTRDLIYTGVCFIKPIISRRDRFDEVGQGLVFTRQYRVGLPHTVDDVQIRDLFTSTASADTQVIGRELLVRDVLVGSNVGYRRLTVQDTVE